MQQVNRGESLPIGTLPLHSRQQPITGNLYTVKYHSIEHDCVRKIASVCTAGCTNQPVSSWKVASRNLVAASADLQTPTLMYRMLHEK